MDMSPEPNDLGSRIREVRKDLGWTQALFAEKLEVVPLTVTRWESGERKVEGPALIAISAVTGSSIQWLKSGKGDKWKDLSGQRTPRPSDLFLDRPLIPGMATCGPGGQIQDPGQEAMRYALRRDFVSRLLKRCGGGTEEDLFFLFCRGESMAPTLLDREIVLLNAALAIRTNPRNNGIYLVRRSPEDPEARVKRVRLDRTKGQLVLASDNRAFPPAIVDLDSVPLHQIILGRVVWVGRYLLDTDPPAEDW